MTRLPKPDEPEARALMAALSSEDALLMDTKRQLDSVRVAWQLIARKYTAVRDLFIEKFGVNPYSLKPEDFGANTFQSSGQFRFLRMNPGEAAAQVLMEAENPMSLEAIVQALREGGLAIDARTVNAALMKKGGVTPTEDGKYRYDPQVDAEEIPFE